MNPHFWSDVGMLGVVVVIILMAPVYWLFRRYFPTGESRAVLRQQITQLENELAKSQRDAVALNSRLLEAAENNHTYEEMQGQL